jgi:hypothetical protein
MVRFGFSHTYIGGSSVSGTVLSVEIYIELNPLLGRRTKHLRLRHERGTVKEK